MKNRVFTIEEHIYNLQISLSELISLSKIPLLALSVISRAEQITSSGWNCPLCVCLAKRVVQRC